MSEIEVKEAVDTGLQARKSVLARGVLSYRDIIDQPAGKFFVLIDTSPVQSILIAVDKIDTSNDTVIFYKATDNPEVFDTVFACSSRLPWHACAATYASVITTEEMAKAASLDHKAMHDLEKTLRAGSNCPDEHGGELPMSAMSALVPTGQYL